MKKRHLLHLLFLALTLAASAIGQEADRSLDWMIGSWQGHRTHLADGSRTPMHIEVEPLLGGKGQLQEIMISDGQSTYRGVWIQIYDDDRELWSVRYANDARRRWVAMEGDGRIYRNSEPDRKRESRLVLERTGETSWRRAQAVSDVGGSTWNEIFVDELERSDEHRAPLP